MEQGFDPTRNAERATNPIRLLVWLAAVPALAIAYYFGIALPGYNSARLELERQQRAEDRQKSEQIAKDAAARQVSLSACLDTANDDYFAYLKLNGTAVRGGNISTTQTVANLAARRKSDDRDACLKQFGR